MLKPANSKGLSLSQVEKVRSETGLNVLSPPKKKHPIVKYIECLFNLFNLLLILAGVLNYILLAIDFEANFPNVSCLFFFLFTKKKILMITNHLYLSLFSYSSFFFLYL